MKPTLWGLGIAFLLIGVALAASSVQHHLISGGDGTPSMIYLEEEYLEHPYWREGFSLVIVGGVIAITGSAIKEEQREEPKPTPLPVEEQCCRHCGKK